MPSAVFDGMGSAGISIDDRGGAFVQYQPFADSLPASMKNGFNAS
jgi:hypothetical protein